MKKKTILWLALTLLAMPCLTQAQTVVPLWKNGAPGFEKYKDIPEAAKDYWVRNINNPTLNIYLPPKDKANGTAMVICPGGGHRLLVYNAEGVEPAKFLSDMGITVFVLKYRLGRDTMTPQYKIAEDGGHDGTRAIQYVRSHAAEYGIDPNRIGMMGFSAGGEIVNYVAFGDDAANPKAADPVDKASSRPNFIVQIYPGPLYVPGNVPHDAPPAFMAAASDDPCCAVPIILYLQQYQAAKVPIEVHIFSKGGHGFNMGHRSKSKAIYNWSARLADWLSDSGYLSPATERPKVEH